MVADEGFVRARGGEPLPGGAARWFVFAGPRVLVAEDTRTPPAASREALGFEAADPLYVGTLDGVPCVAAQLVAAETDEAPTGYAAYDLRRLYGMTSEDVWAVAALSSQLLYWAATTRFCSRTGHATVRKEGEWAAVCPACGFTQYPRVSPCTITLIHDGERMLLTRQPSWPAGRYSLVAGFVEPGETLEQCVEREIREETGVAVTDIAYTGSQPWPFPHQLMIGFTARYAGGAVVVDTSELEDAKWFTLDALPMMPPPLSIARRIIDAHLAAHGRTSNGEDRGW
jgi:NAD+ diphosphatase